MIFSHDAGASGGPSRARRSGSHAFPPLDDDWSTPPKREADWKKVLLLAGLGTLSWISTYTGMLELIQANMGEVALVYKAAIGFAVAMLMLMIIWLLDQLFAQLTWSVRLLFVFGYLFLTLISVGFGFGFYWKFLESRSEATRSASSAVTQVQSALVSAQTRLEQLQTTLDTLTTISAAKAVSEREKGNSCPNSRPGDGPRRRLRDADAKRFAFAGDFVRKRIATVKADIRALNGDLAKVTSRARSTIDAATGTRNAFMKALGHKLDLAVTRFNAFRTDPQLRQFRNDFAERASKTIFPNGRGGTFACPDPQLQAALRGVVRAIDQLPRLEKPKIKTVEGSDAIIEAFRRLTATLFGALQLKLPPSPDELRALQQRAVQSVENVAAYRRAQSMEAGLGKRDYIPLFIAIFVDFCLLLVSVSRPMNEFLHLDHKMRQAQEWPIIRILSRFREIHSDEELRQVFDVFRHVVFDWRGVYYAAIPVNGTNPTRPGLFDDEDAALEARLLANLFTSFEHDRIFRRVPVPMFRTRFVQKKLRQQGSKFAEAEAFRIYRFNRESWSNWILGAIMGAAKRVEAERRARGLEDALFADPRPAAPGTPGATPEAPMATPQPANDHGTGRTEPPLGRSTAAPRAGAHGDASPPAAQSAPESAETAAPAQASAHAPAPRDEGAEDSPQGATVIQLPSAEAAHDTSHDGPRVQPEQPKQEETSDPVIVTPAPVAERAPGTEAGAGEPASPAAPASHAAMADSHLAATDDLTLDARVETLRAAFDQALSARPAEVLDLAREREALAEADGASGHESDADVPAPASGIGDGLEAARDLVPFEETETALAEDPREGDANGANGTCEAAKPSAEPAQDDMLRLAGPARSLTIVDDPEMPDIGEPGAGEDIDVDSISQWFRHGDRVANGKARDA